MSSQEGKSMDLERLYEQAKTQMESIVMLSLFIRKKLKSE